MKFIDEVIITVQSGDGGSGCVSFRRERFVPKGGPDGGDGGRGGHVIFVSTFRQRSLYPFRFKKLFKAQKGGHGRGKQQTGKNGQDLIIEIPAGTLATDAETGQLLKDFDQEDITWIVAEGGMGGRGNRWFKSATQRTPKFAQPGEPGKSLKIKLELKLIADVGIIGLPNAGKSTLISRISSAHPKIGDYPFTTLYPNLGVVQGSYGDPFVVADIPGLIEGAHTGSGLGIQFLRHIERTRLLIHLIDGSALTEDDPLAPYRTVNNELAMHSENLSQKHQLIVINKLDLPGCDMAAARFKSQLEDKNVLCISAVTGEGISDLVSEIQKMLATL